MGEYILTGMLSRQGGEPMDMALSGGVGVTHVTSVLATRSCEVSQWGANFCGLPLALFQCHNV